MPKITVTLPYFFSRTLAVLPEFLEVIGFTLRDVRQIEFEPDHLEERKDPQEGIATFVLFNDSKVVIEVRYQPGEEGTRGSLSKVHYIYYFRPPKKKVPSEPLRFFYIEHHCFCRQCKGTRYPFAPDDPESIYTTEFEEMSEEQRLATIRSYLEKYTKVKDIKS